MSSTMVNDSILFDKLLWIGIGLGVFYWVAESALHVFVFEEGTLASQILSVDLHEIWKRLLVGGLIISLSLYAQLRINERQQAEEALRESESKYRTLFTDALNPIFLLNERGEFIDGNQSALDFFECSREDFIGKSILRFSLDGLRKSESAGTHSFLAQRNVEIDFVQNGLAKTLLLNLVPLKSSGESIVYGIGQDITERKRMERDITLAHTELNQIFQTASVGMRLIDKEFNVIKINETFAALSRAHGMSTIWHKCYEGFGGPLCRKPNCPLQRIMNGETLVECEVDKQRADGSIVHCLLTARPFLGPHGGIQGIVESFKDITELKQAQEDLRSERDKLRNILFQRVEGVCIVNGEGIIEYQNDSLREHIGSCIGQKCYHAFMGNQRSCDDCMMRESIQTGMLKRHEFEAPTGRSYEKTYMPFREADGSEKVVVTLRDITEAKASRAAALRSEQLAAVGELAAGIAHEINNPVNGIINYAQLLINKNKHNTALTDIAGRIAKEGDRVARIVQSLLSFARQEKQKKVPSAVAEILEESLTLTAAQMRKDAIRLHLNIASGLPKVFASPQEIQQVLINVLNNARYALNQKYSDHHEDKIIEIEAESVVIDRTPYVRISCCDHGTGIPPQVIDKVMNPFFSTKPKGKGTGLGLSISHSIVSEHGGKLRIESTAGKFAKVLIDLPVADSPVETRMLS